MPARNVEIFFKEIPKGLPDPSRTFEIRKGTIDLERVELKEGEVLIKTLYASVDPYMRARLRDPSIQSYFPAVVVGERMAGGVVAEVVKSNNPGFTAGNIVAGMGDWAEYSVSKPGNDMRSLQKIPNAKQSPLPLSYHLGLFGIPGITAYVGLHKICNNLTPGKTLYVSAASGAVGQVVGQYAKALGLRVVGSAGDDTKVDFLLKDLGFDAAFNYKKHENFDAILKETCPNGIDIYFENVGGKMLEAVLNNANSFCAIPVCGMISQYNRSENPEPIYNLTHIISKRIRMEGFIVTDDIPKYGMDCIKTFTKLVQEGKMKYKEDISKGIKSLPETFVGMLQGKNFGKAVVHVADF